jgi:acyl-CoA synthetase (AMP-forming)/AMP-acid ligase II
MTTGFLLDTMRASRDRLAVALPSKTYTYGDLLDRIGQWQERLSALALPGGTVVTVEGDYGAETIALFIALTGAGHVAVPLSPDSAAHHETFLEIAQVDVRVHPDGRVERLAPPDGGQRAQHEIYDTLRARRHPGLVLFSSGSTGKNKAAVHDLDLLLGKYKTARHTYRTLVFLLLDHIGGVNTLFYTLSNGGAVVVPRDRSPLAVFDAIEQYQVELLPTSPTFLNLLLLSGEHTRRDTSALKLITYGTEPMPASTLTRVTAAFPHAKLLQTYGLTEVGILRSQSRDSNSLWVRVGGDDFETKVVDGRLWIRATSAMIGYLNAPSPFDAEGFLDTGDLVETDGEWIRFLGRKGEIINVGGSKVYPAEVDSVLLEMPNVVDAVVHGEPHAITGQIVVASVRLATPEAPDEFKARMRRFCAERLASYKIPARVKFVDGPLHSARFKRLRKQTAVPA